MKNKRQRTRRRKRKPEFGPGKSLHWSRPGEVSAERRELKERYTAIH